MLGRNELRHVELIDERPLDIERVSFYSLPLETALLIERNGATIVDLNRQVKTVKAIAAGPDFEGRK